MRLKVFLILQSALALLCHAEASAQTDSLQLDSTVVSARRRTAIIAAGAGTQTRIELARINILPSILGNSDPLHFAQLLPSMQSSSELDAGVHIQGCEHQHNLIALDGVPVYGASHLMGIFSVFNATHFDSMTYGTIAPDAGRLGGVLDMHVQKDLPKNPSLNASVGLLSAQGTYKAPLGNRAALVLSGRRSFINLLYGGFLKLDKTPLRYGFGDYNATVLWKPSEKDRIALNFYYGNDSALGGSSRADIGVDLYWGNLMTSLNWEHGGFSQTAYYTSYKLDAFIGTQNQEAWLPSHIHTTGYKASWKSGGLRIGADFAAHEVLPQDPQVKEDDYLYDGEETMHAGEASLSAYWNGTIGYAFSYGAGLTGGWYLSPEKRSFLSLSPEVEIGYDMFRAGNLKLRAGTRRQNLYQTGLSNLGMPMEFWLPAGKYGDPQWSLYSSLAYNLEISRGDARLSAELYWRDLGNQMEYTGGVLEFLDGTYSLARSIETGKGRSYGLNLMLQKLTGRLTGWVGLSAGRSLRTFNGKTWPSNHERLVEFNAVASYSIRKWDFGGTFLAAGGTPFTEPLEYYLLNGQMVAVYAEHNNSRLQPYIRLDLNAKLHLKDWGRAHQALNFSVYNATLHKQEIFRTVHSDRDNNTFSYGPLYLGLTILPSVSYEITF